MVKPSNFDPDEINANLKLTEFHVKEEKSEVAMLKITGPKSAISEYVSKHKLQDRHKHTTK